MDDTATTFRRGDEVTFFQDWDRKGTVTVFSLRVHAAGKVRMVLVDEDGVKFAGVAFYPRVEQAGGKVFHRRLTDEATDALGLEVGAAIVTQEKDAMLAALARDGESSRAYIEAQIGKLHEPRIHRVS